MLDNWTKKISPENGARASSASGLLSSLHHDVTVPSDFQSVPDEDDVNPFVSVHVSCLGEGRGGGGGPKGKCCQEV